MLIYIIIIIAGIILDQVTKMSAVLFLSNNVTTLPIIPNVFHLTYVENTGAAFNILDNMQGFLIVVTIIFIILLCYLFLILPKRKRKYILPNIALSLMISGAIGNLIDRIRLSYVIDFLDVRLIGFAVFNIADSLVVIGTILLAYSLLKNQNMFSRPKRKRRETKIVSEEPKPLDEEITEEIIVEERPKRPKRVRKNYTNPEIKTSLKILPSIPDPLSVSLSYETPESDPEPFIEETPVKIYDPKEFRLSNEELDKVQSASTKITNDEETIIIYKDNKYNRQSEEYLKSIERIRENDLKKNKEKDSSNRYKESLNSYEESIRRQKQQSKPQKNSIWEPEIRNPEVKVKSYEVTWNPESESHVKPNKYAEQISRYAESVKEQTVTKKKETIQWEPVKRQKTETKEEEKKKPTSRNRYNDYTDHYIESIKEASQKTYTNKK